jgi:hypothetical protein
VVLTVVPWLLSSWPENSICWKESQVNSDARRAWTAQAAAYMREHYQAGSGIILNFGDIPAILREAGIPLRESLHQDNIPAWQGAVARPEFFLREEWAVTIAGDPVDDAIVNASRTGPRYECVESIEVKGAPVVRIYRRN